MTRFAAIFSRVDGLDETDIGNSYGLNAESLEEAEGEALGMGPPSGANLLKILDEGRVVKRHGIGL